MKSTNDGTLKDYTLDFELFENKDVLKLVRALEANHVREIELIKSSTTSRIYSVLTDSIGNRVGGETHEFNA